MKQASFLIGLLFFGLTASAQTGVIRGQVTDAITGEPLPFANVVLIGTTKGVSTDLDGNYEMKEIPAGLQNFSFSFVGYKEKLVAEIRIAPSAPVVKNVALDPASTELEAAVVKPSLFSKPVESPVSMRNIGVSEIERSPGSNRDISKVIASLPGVAQGVAFRNDLNIRGGGPNENRFYLDDVETPNINHFATQGASGGPVGMIDVNYLSGVDFFTGAFPANRGNALSSVLVMKYREPRDDKKGFKLTVGASDFGIASEGPLGERTDYIVSVRRSYLQFLFSVLELPFLPNYTDLQYKVRHKLKNNDEFYTIFLGAYDINALNLDANDTPSQRYILSYLPEQDQWSYTNGYVYKHYENNGYSTFVFSRNMLKNINTKFENNDEDATQVLDYESVEAENKIRIETTKLLSNWKINAGVNAELADYSNRTVTTVVTDQGPAEVNYNTAFTIFKYGGWVQGSTNLMEERLSLSVGFRMDGNDYSDDMNNPLEQFSPRISMSYSITPQLSANFNVGSYYQLPPYTTMGYAEDGVLINRENNLKYINAKHVVAGMSYNTSFDSQISIEGFYKDYDDYPLTLRDSVSLANFGSDFGVIGDVPVKSISEGRAYGVEFLYQQKMFKGFYGIVAYTYVRSEFGFGGEYFPSAWDQRHLVSITAGKRFNKGWELGAKWRYSAGTPYTPINVAVSSLIPNYSVNPLGIRDYSQLNAIRTPAFHTLDIRLDKKIFTEKASLNFYLDIQNSYNFIAQSAPLLVPETDDDGNYIVDPNDPNSYLTRLEENSVGNILPTIGVIIDF